MKAINTFINEAIITNNITKNDIISLSDTYYIIAFGTNQLNNKVKEKLNKFNNIYTTGLVMLGHVHMIDRTPKGCVFVGDNRQVKMLIKTLSTDIPTFVNCSWSYRISGEGTTIKRFITAPLADGEYFTDKDFRDDDCLVKYSDKEALTLYKSILNE